MISHQETFTSQGFCILPKVFAKNEVAAMRAEVLANEDKMGATRPNPKARHLAGFHRFDRLGSLHARINAAPRIDEALNAVYDGAAFEPIGLTDITVNRSQPWHTDLLRGKYSHFLSPDICWGEDVQPCIKVLVYLQDGASLRVVPGSHLQPVELDSDAAVVPGDGATIEAVAVRTGDVILMDIRLTHRGQTEDETMGYDLDDSAKILISTVYGASDSPLARAMKAGNAARMADWDARHLANA